MNAYYLLIIVGTLVGFCGLAYLLLAPIWRFLDREEEVSKEWTRQALARRRRRGKGSAGDGAKADDPGPDADPPPPPSEK